MHREVALLAVLVAVTIAAFIGTRAVAISTEALRSEQAAAWFDAAQRAAAAGNTDAAATGLRRAVARDPGNTAYRLALADALTASLLDEEATRVLLALRDREPEDPESNLRLARLARASDPDAARRYYQSASAGLWRPERADARRQVQIELTEFLLSQQEQARARAELLVLATNLPDDTAVRVRVGRMSLAAGDPRLALDHFMVAIRLDAGHQDALAGAGEAAFELGDYAGARRYLNRVSPESPRVRELRAVTQLVITADPLAPRLTANERQRRLVAAVQQARRRFEACLGAAASGPGADLQALRDEAHAFEAVLALPRSRESPERVDDGLDLAYRIERAVESSCATPQEPFDRALLLIGRRHGYEQP